MSIFKKKEKNEATHQEKRPKPKKLMILVGVITIWFGIMSVFAFREIPYLSDGTYLVSKWPVVFIIVAVLFVVMNIYFMKKKITKARVFLTAVSIISVISLTVNSVVFAVSAGQKEPEISTATSGNPAVFDGQTFMAGAAKGDITPAENLMPMPLLFILRFDKVVDPVYARVLALSDGNQEALFIMLDMTLVPEAEETLNFISENTGIPKENIFIGATHAHGVTPVSLVDFSGVDGMKCREWYGQIKETLLATIEEARANMVPAKYGYGTGESYINVNRDIVTEDGKSVLGSNFERPSDKTVRMVRIEDLNGNAIALVVNYACHSVVVNGSLHLGLRTDWTGDLAGKTSYKLEEQMDGAVVLWSMAAAGDQNPRIMTQYGGPIQEGKPIQSNLGKVGYNILEYLSDEHTRDILNANETIECTETDAKLYCAEKIVTVDSKDGDGEVSYKLRIFMLGDIAFEGVSAEIVTSIGKAIMETSPYENTILVTIANGYNGYCADDWEYEHDAFEVDNSKAAKGEAQKAFVNGFEELFSNME